MAHFYGEIRGTRGVATRTGSKESGFWGNIRGWNIGVKVSCSHNKDTGKDEIFVYQTDGSSGWALDKFITKIVGE